MTTGEKEANGGANLKAAGERKEPLYTWEV